MQKPHAITVIANAHSGTGCPEGWPGDVEAKFALAGVDAGVTLVQGGGQLAQAVQQALEGGAKAVVAAGGDGTVSAVASVLAGGKVPLGVLPMGTLNHFAKDLGIPLELDQAIANVAAGNETPVDLGEVNGRTFINNSSLGLYPDIVRDREQRQRRLGKGKWRALAEASVAALKRYPVLRVQIEVKGQRVLRRTPFVFVGNNLYTMEGFSIGERPTVADGQLSLYATQDMGRFGLFQLAWLALLRRLDQARDFDVATGTGFIVHTPRKHLRVAADGEVFMMQTPLNYSVRPAALRVIVPLQEAAA